MFRGQTNLNLTNLFGNHECRLLQTKEGRDLLACYQHYLLLVQKLASLMVWGCISAYGVGSLHILKGTINAVRCIQVLEQHMFASRQCLFQRRPCIIQQDNAILQTASRTTACLRSRRVRVFNRSACSPDLSPIKNIWHVLKRKI